MALTQQDKEELYQYIVSRGQSIAGLPEGEATLTNKYLGPVIEYGGGDASGRLVRLAVSLLQGKPAMLRNEGGLIQWAVQGTNAWETLVNVSQLKGENGKNPVFRKNGPNLEYKIDGTPDTAYQTLVALSEITGPEGDHIVLDVRDGAVMYKQSKAPDSDFQPVFFLADVKGEKGDTGPAPILVFGTVTTVEPSEPAAAEWVENGIDASGAKIYQLNLSIPKGRDGADGSGSGNVSVPPASLKAGVTYLFKPSADGSAKGEFIEYTAPTQLQSDWNATDTDLPSFIQNKPALKPVATSGSYNDLENKPSIPNLNNLTSNIKFTNTHTTDGTKSGIQGTAAGSDYWNISAHSTAQDGLELEIATGDNGNEPIVVRQYRTNPASTPTSQAVRTAHLLDGAGNTYFPRDIGAGGTIRSGGVDLVKTNDPRLSDRRDFKYTSIPADEDLNNYTTPGVFNCLLNVTVATLKNCPTLNAFSLIVLPTANRGIIQYISTFNIECPLLFFRAIYQNEVGNWFRSYTTIDPPPLATYVVNGLMSTIDKKRSDRNAGFNMVSSLADLPTDKRLILCSLTASSAAFSFKNALESGSEYHIIIRNAGTAAITQSIFIGSGSVYFGGQSITIPPAGYYEVNLIYRENGIFYVRSGGQ